jgi:hypothetical protein
MPPALSCTIRPKFSASNTDIVPFKDGEEEEMISNLPLENINDLISQLSPYFKHDIPIVDLHEVDVEAEAEAEATSSDQETMEDSSDPRQSDAPNLKKIALDTSISSETSEEESVEDRTDDDVETSSLMSIPSSTPEHPNGSIIQVQPSASSSDMRMPGSGPIEPQSSMSSMDINMPDSSRSEEHSSA